MKWSIAAWLTALLLMLAFLGTPPVQRTQEARVLETAREMLGQGWRDWMIPHLNGQIRLEKPPLAYWLSAIAFRVGGVSEAVGRVPFALAGWGTLILTAWIAHRLFGDTVAWISAAALLGGLMFARHARLAETDILATFFVTAAIVFIWRGAQRDAHRSTVWFAISGAMLGLAILAKGLPALFALLFLIALAGAERNWRLLWRWTRSGAPFIAAAIAIPWFAYVSITIGNAKLISEVAVGVAGEEHKAWFVEYFPQLLRATAPWSGLMVVGIIHAAGRWRSDWKLRGLLIWSLSIFLPLCIAGQKQSHYLLPLLPPLAIISAWALHEAMRSTSRDTLMTRRVFLATLIVILLAPVAVIISARKIRGSVGGLDFLMIFACLAAVVPALLCYRRRLRVSAATFALATPIALTLLVQLWMPSLRVADHRDVAAGLRSLGSGPYCFYGENVSFPLVFAMRTVIPQITDARQLQQAATEQPSLLVIAQSKAGRTPPPLPSGFERIATIRADDQNFEIYHAAN
jgi:4-amino-4-deoxy-L-arabinose transferase-like glycosyltransferase